MNKYVFFKRVCVFVLVYLVLQMQNSSQIILSINNDYVDNDNFYNYIDTGADDNDGHLEDDDDDDYDGINSILSNVNIDDNYNH